MRISFVSDVHGNYEALAEVAAQADQLVVLGDLLDYVDYRNPGLGILGEIFGAAKTTLFGQLRARGEFAALHRLNSDLWSSLADPIGTIDDAVAQRYERALAALQVASTEPLLILGNVDVAASWAAVAGEQLPALDAAVREVAGLRLGFVGGGASQQARVLHAERRIESVWRPYVRGASEYAAAVASVVAAGNIDILCTHLPPKLAGLRYDVVTARLEMFAPDLLSAIDSGRPRLSVFGHVHAPLQRRMQRGTTTCVNVGHFSATGRPFVISVPS